MARFAFRVNGPGVLANNLVTDGQPQPRAGADLFGGKHGIENVRQGFARHSRARIRKDHFHFPARSGLLRLKVRAPAQLPMRSSPPRGMASVLLLIKFKIPGAGSRNLRKSSDSLWPASFARGFFSVSKTGDASKDGVFQHPPQVHQLQPQFKLARPGLSNCRTVRTMFSTCFSITRSRRAVASSLLLRRASNCTCPEMELRGVPISCARLAASCPATARRSERARFFCVSKSSFVDAPQFLIPARHFAGGFLHLAAHFIAEVLDAPQHAIQVGG
jgi:hypothetical protein